MTGQFDKVLTLLSGIGIFGFMVANGDKVASLAKGLVAAALQYVGGIAGMGGNAA